MLVYFTHFLYFAPLPNIFPYFDALFAYTSLLVFPLYYIYFRLLTVDSKFSLKIHGKYLIVGTIAGTLYAIGVLLAPKMEYRVWLYNQTSFADNPQIKFLAQMRILGKITYLIQVILTVIGNFQLIRKYGAKAEQYYSDIDDGKYNNAKILNYSIIAMSVVAFFFGAMGRYSLSHFDTYIEYGWSIFAIILFVIGYMGFKQKALNPTFELSNAKEDLNQNIDISDEVQKKILDKLLFEFEHNKIYLNNQLNIMDVVDIIGTNRTYISAIINKQYNLNFCSFVNNYRLEELKRIITENPNLNKVTLAENSGFGSFSSMKRTIESRTGYTYSKWKNNF
jgi:AraC-like DNA-binding protein